MGAWSAEIYGNDTAADWAWGLDDSSDLTLIIETLEAVLDDEEDYLDASTAEEALAAAEALTFLLGRPARTNAYTESVENWAKRVDLDVPPEVLAIANLAIARILSEESELRELWEESDGGEEWMGEVQGLLQRLGG